jgi:hypothetical protein
MVIRVIWMLIWFLPYPNELADLMKDDAFPKLQVTDRC